MSSSQAPSNSQSASASASGSASGSTSSRASTTVSIPATAAAGGVSVTQPPTTATPSYFKIAENEFITFGWNLTSLYVQPSNITIIASCSANGNTYAVGPTTAPYNVLPANATQVIWNPWEAEQVPGAIPFAQATYVLKMWDERGPGSAVKGGYMSPYSGTQFAMYRPAPYTSNADGWKCTTCSSAMAAFSHPSSLAIVTTLMISVFTFWNFFRR